MKVRGADPPGRFRSNQFEQWMTSKMSITQTRQLNGWQRVFGCDVRSLAIFRMALGLTIIADLVLRWSSLTAMYTDDGYYTRQVSYDQYQSQFNENWTSVIWSFHWLSGSLEFQVVLFAVAALFAVLLSLGLFTRVATVASWLLLISLHMRNPVILSSGDTLLKLVLFWSMFIPLGTIWSIDAWRAGRRLANVPATITNIATAGLIIQLFCMYFFTGLAKWNPIWWDGDAMYYVLRLDIYVVEFGRNLLNYPFMLKLTSWLTVIIEVFLIALIFSPWKTGWFRMINLVVFWAFHIGIALAMTIGLFPLISMACWLMLIPGGVWERLGIRTAERDVSPTPAPSPVKRVGYMVVQGFCAFMILFVLIWNFSNIEHATLRSLRPQWMNQFGYRFCLNQHFQMFGIPTKHNVWFVYEGTLKDGSKVDPFRNGPVEYKRPEWVSRTFPTHHWRRIHANLAEKDFKNLRQPMVDYLVRKWNQEHPSRPLNKLRMLFFFQQTGPDFKPENQASLVFGSYRDEYQPGSLFDEIADDLGDGLDGLLN